LALPTRIDGDMVGRETGLMARVHGGVGGFEMRCEKPGIEQGRRQTIIREFCPDDG
jgi:hypothetical protein